MEVEGRPRNSSKCVIYCRVSSVKQTTKGSGLQGQERSCRDYAERRGYQVVEVFRDVISGAFAERPGIKELESFLLSVAAEDYVVVVYDISRVARDIFAHAALRSLIGSTGAALESPTVKFGDDASSRFAEYIQALSAQFERERIVETGQSRSRSRLLNGYWVFPVPKGYRYERGVGGGKIVVRDEPLATIVQEALNGFATGRFQSPVEVKRFLEAKPEFPKIKGKNEIKIDVVSRMLRNVLYAGYLEQSKAPWNIPLTKARHEALISYQTFETIQSRLEGRAVAPARSNIKRDFVLSGLMECETCGRGITYCWARSGTGRKYPYYFCPNKDCPDGGKSIRRGKLEHQLEGILAQLSPSKEVFEVAEQVFRSAWDSRVANSTKEAARLRARSTQIDKDIGKLVQLITENPTGPVVEDYENRIADLHAERAVVDEQAKNLELPVASFEQMFELSMDFLASPCKIWKSGDYVLRRLVLRLVFPQRIKFNRKDRLRTPETTFPFRVLRFLEQAEIRLVGPAGFKLVVWPGLPEIFQSRCSLA